MAESERYLPTLLSKIEDLLDEAGISEERDYYTYDRLS